MHVTPFNCRPKPKICRLKPVICRPAQEHSRHEPVMDCRPEPPCVVTDIPKRACIFFESLDPSMMKPYHKCDQRRLRRACAFVQSRQGLAAH